MENEGLGPATPGTAARCEECAKHEGCIDEMRKDFDLTLDQQLDRAEAAEKRVADLEQSLRNIYEAQGWRKLLGDTAAGPAEPVEEAVPEIERLKAENASLLESLQQWKTEEAKQRMLRAAAEQRAEAAEKALFAAQQSLIREGMERDRAMELARAAEQRNTALEGALRAFRDSHRLPLNLSPTLTYRPCDEARRCNYCMEADAALHDEERGAPPQEEK